MEVINSADFFGANIEVREENFKSLLKKETEERYLGNYDEPMYFFMMNQCISSKVPFMAYSSVFPSGPF